MAISVSHALNPDSWRAALWRHLTGSVGPVTALIALLAAIVPATGLWSAALSGLIFRVGSLLDSGPEVLAVSVAAVALAAWCGRHLHTASAANDRWSRLAAYPMAFAKWLAAALLLLGVAVPLTAVAEGGGHGAAGLIDLGRDFFRLALVQTIIAFSLLWTTRVALSGVIALTRGPNRGTVMLGLARGLLGAAAAAAVTASIAANHGAELTRLYAPRDFYILVVPAVAGFGWTAPWPKAPSRLFGAALTFVAIGMAVFTLMRPFTISEEIDCEYWYPTGVHDVYGFYTTFRYEPWHWQLPYAVDALFIPGALGELTVRYVRQPLTELRCKPM